MDPDIGPLEPSELTDVVIFDGNPLQNIHRSAKVTGTMALGGREDVATLRPGG